MSYKIVNRIIKRSCYRVSQKGNDFPKFVYKFTRGTGAKVKSGTEDSSVDEAILSWQLFNWVEKHGKEPDDRSVESEHDASA